MHKDYMALALKEAKLAYDKNEVPVGCVIVKDSKVIASAHNTREKDRSTLSHAELKAIDEACKKLNDWRLTDTLLYVTLEPCPMCMGAIINARIPTVIFGAYDKNFGCADSVIPLLPEKFGLKTEILGGICENECQTLLSDFFQKIR